MEEEQAIRRETVSALYEAHGHLVVSRCRYLLRDRAAADDAAQDVFVKVLRAYDAFRGESSAVTWLLRIATNHCLNLLASQRAGWRRRYETQVRHADAEARVAAVDPERARAVRRVLERLDSETQAVAIHYCIDEMTQEEIAALLGRSLPTIRKRLEKFRRVSKKELGHEPP